MSPRKSVPPPNFRTLHSKAAALIQQSEQQRVRLIESEFTVAHTYCDLAETEAKLRNRKHARELIDKVKLALGVAKHHIERAPANTLGNDDMRRQLDELEERVQLVLNQIV